ncbi:MAG: hypothetical protein KF689_01495 [Gemmatimonadaceae bacterium]|nr:hypothetical protein [Gemmatimonadaceae bacterium]MCW5826603.1 hypothetical protein [Gemmatimonadaceae bacterium]
MHRSRLLRGALWASVGLNGLGVAIFAPLAFGRPSPFVPVDVSPFFAAQVGFTIALFGGVYAWMARQRVVPAPLLVVGGLGKLGFFALTLAYAIAGQLPAQMAISALPDLAFALVFLAAARAPQD